MPKPKLVEVIRDIEVLLAEHIDDAELFQCSPKMLFVDRMIACKNALKCALDVEKMLAKNGAQLETNSATAAAGATAATAGGAPPRALAPQFQFTDRQNMDIKYSVSRSKEFEKPIAFAPGIDAYSAIVGILISCGQGHKFANSVAFRTCFQGFEPQEAFYGADKKDYHPPKLEEIRMPPSAKPVNPNRMQGFGFPYKDCKCNLALWRQREDRKEHKIKKEAERKRRREEVVEEDDDDDNDDNDDDDDDEDDENIFTFMDDKVLDSSL